MAEAQVAEAAESAEEQGEEQLPPGVTRVSPERMVIKMGQRLASMAQENAGLQVLVEDMGEEIVALRAALVEATSTRPPPRAQTKRPKAAPKRP